jgi:L-rhamnose mutarotase
VTARVCFQLRINPAKAEEYKARHAAVWPEMLDALRDAGWRNYSLFLAPDGMLIGYLECENFEQCLEMMAATEVNARWQESMSEFFVGLEGAPDEGMHPLEEVFHLE